MSLNYRLATAQDAPLLAQMNRELIQDEGHRNPMSLAELEARMRGWLQGDYQAILFEHDGQVVAYALYRDEPTQLYLRHFFVARDQRRLGIGRAAFDLLRRHIWPSDKRLCVEVLWHNERARAFWLAMGFREYSLELEILPS